MWFRILLITAATQLVRAQPFILSLSRVQHKTYPHFASFSFDASVMKADDPFGFFTSERVAVLLGGLTPGYFRFSGTAIDGMLWNETATCEQTGNDKCISAGQLTRILNLTTASGLDLILGLNGRVGKSADAPNAPWNSTNGIALLTWLESTVSNATNAFRPPYGYELGNEPDLWPWSANGTHLVNGSQLAADVFTLRAILASLPTLSGGGNASLIRTFGPDTCNCYNGDVVLPEFAAAVAPSTLPSQAFTWHFYNQGTPKSSWDMVSVDRADYLIGKIQQAVADIGAVKRPELGAVPIIIGETGECVNGGCLGPPGNETETVGGGPQRPYWSEEFVDGYLFLDKLGLSAALNVSAIMKEKVFGGNDQFINPLSYPNAPYWVMLLHKQLAGTSVLTVLNSTTPGRSVRVYAQCARVWGAADRGQRLVPEYRPGAVLLLAINLDNTTAAVVDLYDADTGAILPTSPRDEYRLTGPMPSPLPGNDTGCAFTPGLGPKMPYFPSSLCLNGHLLYMSDGPLGANTTMPVLTPVSIPLRAGGRADTDSASVGAAPLSLPPLSYSMFVLPSAGAKACMPA